MRPTFTVTLLTTADKDKDDEHELGQKQDFE